MSNYHEQERRSYAEFASLHAEKEYRNVLADFYQVWWLFNDQFFESRLVEPHFAIGRTAPRSLGHCAKSTDYGGKLQIILNAGLAFGTNRDWVANPGPPAEGTKRFLGDFVRRFTLQQFILEVLGSEERGYRGFGPKFASEANRIGISLGLSPVVARRQGTDTESPLAHGWPHCVRPAGYYGDDITEHALDLATGRTHGPSRAGAVPTIGLLELLHFLLARGRANETQQLIERHLEWRRRYRESSPKPQRRAENGHEDTDGNPLGVVTFDPAWLLWNDGTVRKIAQGIYEERSFCDLPILADALEEAGCGDARILRHLREFMEHSRRCWVLKLLLALQDE